MGVSHTVAVGQVLGAGFFPSLDWAQQSIDGLFAHTAGASAGLPAMDGAGQAVLSFHMVFPFVWLELPHSLVFTGNQTSYVVAGLSQRKYPEKPKQILYSFLGTNFGSYAPFYSILVVRREFPGPTQSLGQRTTQGSEF